MFSSEVSRINERNQQESISQQDLMEVNPTISEKYQPTTKVNGF
jgi:hypothetical protein